MDVDANKVCGGCLARLRRESGLTQVELATRLGVPQSYVSKIETGERSLRAYELFGYATALGISAESLVSKLERTLCGNEKGHQSKD